MEAKYSKKIISKLFKTKSGEERIYKAAKLSSRTIFIEGTKLLKCVLPSVGAAIDSMSGKDEDDIFNDMPKNTFGTAFQYLMENLSDDHMNDLTLKLMGKMFIGDDEIKDIDEYFNDHPENFLDILVWLFKENFGNFIMENDILASMISKVSSLLTPKMKEMLEKMKNDLKDSVQEDKEQ
jgi:hypothetical protein